MPGPANISTPSKVHQALKDGLISESDIENRVLNSMKLLEKVGKFADRRPTPAEKAIDKPEHRALIREAGRAGVVLLKNDRNILPIDVATKKKIALLGPLAKAASAHGGGSSFLSCHYKISPYEAFNERFGSQVEFLYSKGKAALVIDPIPCNPAANSAQVLTYFGLFPISCMGPRTRTETRGSMWSTLATTQPPARPFTEERCCEATLPPMIRLRSNQSQ